MYSYAYDVYCTYISSLTYVLCPMEAQYYFNNSASFYVVLWCKRWNVCVWRDKSYWYSVIHSFPLFKSTEANNTPLCLFFTIVCAVTENDRHMWWIGKWNFCSFLEQRCVIIIVTVSCFSECLNTYRLHLLLTICFLLIFCWLFTDLFFCRRNTTKGNGITAGIYTNVYKITITMGSKKLPIFIFPHGWG